MRLTEEQVIQRLKGSADQYAPLIIESLEKQVPLQMGFRRDQADAVIDFSIKDGPCFKAIAGIACVSSPKSIQTKSRELVDYISKYNSQNVVPLVIAPYIGMKQAKILEDNGISWLDLSGNMSIRVSNRVYIERTGKPNRFPDTAPIKKIFQGTSSLVSRALLLKPEGFSSLYEMVDFINNRNAKITLSTVSKVLKSLEEDLLVTKSKKLIYVMNAEKLLERLKEGYINSTERKAGETYRFATDKPDAMFFAFNEMLSIDYVACGFYAAQIKGLAVTDKITIFVRSMASVTRAAVRNQIQITPDAEFGNVSITESSDPGVWFNADIKPRSAVVDDIELYLEMMADTPRGPKIAEQLKRRILQKGDSDGQQAN
jgi:DNA-binding transcriptional ArsR family regulator